MPTTRAARPVIGVAVGVLVVAGALLGITGPGPTAAAVAPPSTVPVAPPTTEIPTATTVPTVTTPGVAVTVPRAGTSAGSVAKETGEDWSIRRIATTVGLVVLGLAAIGFVYGRIRSSGPRRPSSALVPTSD